MDCYWLSRLYRHDKAYYKDAFFVVQVWSFFVSRRYIRKTKANRKRDGLEMKILKVINNNLVRSKNQKGQGTLVMGCGLGFQKKRGDDVDESKIEHIYVEYDVHESQKLEELLANLPVEYIQVANEIIDCAAKTLKKDLNDHIYLTLTDHISYAIERAEKGVVVKNALLWEIRRFYSEEYQAALQSLKIIKSRLNVELPEDEAGFIALHFVNAMMSSLDMGFTTEMLKTIQRILNIVRYHFKMEFDEDSIHYERFITHLKFFVQRVFTDTEFNDNDGDFLLILKKQYQNEYLCALKVKDYINKEYGKNLTEDELIYLTVHLRRISHKETKA